MFVAAAFCISCFAPADSAWAGHRRRKNVATEVVVTQPAAYPTAYKTRTLGTFQPTPYIIVRGSNPAGNGYAPLGMYGDQAMVEYGPFSPLRAGSAPVQTYTRGYDGQVRLTDAVTTSYPNMPVLAPVVYPTQANNFFGPRTQSLPAGASAINWRDQN